MAAAQRPSPIFFLWDRVSTCKFTDDPVPEHGWTKIECASKRSYGCGQHAKKALQGLTLYACPSGDDDESPLTSSLAIRMTDEAFQRFDSEIQLTCTIKDITLKEMLVHDDRMIAAGTVKMADEHGLTVIVLSFRREFCQDLAYYLVYDNPTASLSLIPYAPDLFETVCTSKPVAKRNASDDFELFVMGREVSPVPRGILCACTPETRANSTSSDGSAGPWLINKPFEHEEFVKEPFMADVAFTFQTKGIYGDLSRGLVYCDLNNNTDFGFIGLPRECLLDDSEEEVEFDENAKATRTMSCVGGSIWFVCIDLHATDPKDDLVKMWALKGNFQNPRWEKMVEVRASEIWGFDGFEEARLPRGAPLEYPLLMADGALCVVLADQNKIQRNRYRAPVEIDICIFDMSRKRLQWHGFIHRHIIWSSLLISSKASMVDESVSSTNTILQQLG